MSKYKPLSMRLAGDAGPEWRASFAELEKILGFSLPKTARSQRAWWGNEPNAKQRHQTAWLEHGWLVYDLDQGAGWVIFRRVAPPAEPTTAPSIAVTGDEPAILKRLEASPRWGAVALVAGGVALVAGLGALAFRGGRRRKA